MDVLLVGPAGLDDAQVTDAAGLLGRLVAGGVALGWVAPPSPAEVRELLGGPWDGVEAALAVAVEGGRLVALGYWRRYARPTHRPHADVEKVAVDPAFQGRGLGAG